MAVLLEVRMVLGSEDGTCPIAESVGHNYSLLRVLVAVVPMLAVMVVVFVLLRVLVGVVPPLGVILGVVPLP